VSPSVNSKPDKEERFADLLDRATVDWGEIPRGGDTNRASAKIMGLLEPRAAAP